MSATIINYIAFQLKHWEFFLFEIKLNRFSLYFFCFFSFGFTSHLSFLSCLNYCIFDYALWWEQFLEPEMCQFIILNVNTWPDNRLASVFFCSTRVCCKIIFKYAWKRKCHKNRNFLNFQVLDVQLNVET